MTQWMGLLKGFWLSLVSFLQALSFLCCETAIVIVRSCKVTGKYYPDLRKSEINFMSLQHIKENYLSKVWV